MYQSNYGETMSMELHDVKDRYLLAAFQSCKTYHCKYKIKIFKVFIKPFQYNKS